MNRMLGLGGPGPAREDKAPIGYRRRCTNCGKPCDDHQGHCDECMERYQGGPDLTLVARVDEELRGRDRNTRKWILLGLAVFFLIVAVNTEKMSTSQFLWLVIPALIVYFYISMPKRGRRDGAPVPPPFGDGIGMDGGGIDC